MYDIGIIEASYDMCNDPYLPYRCKETVAKPLAFACTLYKSCDIHEFNSRRNLPLRRNKLGNPIKPAIWNSYDTNVRIYGTEWIIRRLCRS